MLGPAFRHKIDSLACSAEEFERQTFEAHNHLFGIDLSDVEELTAFLDMAHESYNEGNPQRAWSEIAHAEGVLFFGRQRLVHLANLLPDIGETLRHAIE
jgi:hypothetical protein